MNGKLLWEKDLGDKKMRNEFGEGQTPVLHGNTLVVQWDHQGPSFITALDKMTGKTVWVSKELSDDAGYASPIVADVGGVRTIMTFTSDAGVGVRASDGKLMWRNSSAANGTANIATPVYSDGRVFFTSSYGTGAALLGLKASGNEVRAQIPKIRDVYAEEGYFLAKVSYRLIPLPNNQVEVRFEIVEGPEVSVRRMQFIGNDHLGEDDLLGFMRTHPTSFFSMISSNDTFKRDFFDEDVLRIQALYYDRGYLNVQVAPPRIELTPDRQQIDIVIPIVEGPRFKIGRLRVIEYGDTGSEIEPLGGRRAVREKIDAEPGDWFSRTKLTGGIEEITRHYRDESFAKVEVTPETELDVENKLVHVTVQIRRGPSSTSSASRCRATTRRAIGCCAARSSPWRARSTTRPCSSAARTA